MLRPAFTEIFTFRYSFVRKGKVNAYKEELSQEMVGKLDDWMDVNLKRYNTTLDELLLLDNETKA